MNAPIRVITLSTLILFSSAGVDTLRAQDQRPVIIIGTVIDSADGHPLADAIVYIPNSGIGATTGADGRFTLRLPSRGGYDVVASLIGYRRERIHVAPSGADTITLDIRLAPQPVLPGGVEVVAEGEAATAAQPLFFPDGGENGWCAYGSETEIPVGILFTEKAVYMYALEKDSSGDERYVRLWLLVFNVSKDTLPFDAQSKVSLDMRSGGKLYRNVEPDASTRGKDTPAGVTIQAERPLAVERTLTVMASQSQIFIDRALKFDQGGCSCPWPWTGANSPDEHPAGVNPRYLMEIYNLCTHAGTLANYRVFPASGVDGFIRYPLPGFQSPVSGNGAAAEFKYTYEFTITTPSGDQRIVFTAR